MRGQVGEKRENCGTLEHEKIASIERVTGKAKILVYVADSLLVGRVSSFEVVSKGSRL